jgi:hypothetical protein
MYYSANVYIKYLLWVGRSRVCPLRHFKRVSAHWQTPINEMPYSQMDT